MSAPDTTERAPDPPRPSEIDAAPWPGLVADWYEALLNAVAADGHVHQAKLMQKSASSALYHARGAVLKATPVDMARCATMSDGKVVVVEARDTWAEVNVVTEVKP